MRKWSIYAVGLLIMSQVVQARTINVADHGIVPGKDVTYKLNELIESVKSEAGVVLSFPKGQYDFYRQEAVEHYRYVANHDNGLKRMAFPIFGAKDITIDGNESLFMFHDRIVPITVESTSGVTLKNFTIDFIRPFHAELHVVKSDLEARTLVVKVAGTQHPYKIKNQEVTFERFGQWDPIGSNIVFDPETRSPIFNTARYKLGSGVKVRSVGNDLLEISHLGKKSLPAPVGSVLIVYGVHPTSRLVPAIHVTNSEDLKIENVKVLDAGGMALIVERTNNIHLDGYTVTSADHRIAATRADASHFIGCRGTLLVENSLMEHMLDDGINVHGAYVNVDRYVGDNKFIASISHFQQMGLKFAEPGDEVAILSRETVLPFHKTRVTKVRSLNDKRFEISLENIPASLPDVPMSMENLTWNPDLIFRNNTVRENRARGALITTKGAVLVENNYFNNQMHGILIEGDNKKWYESGAVQDVTIRNNTFVNVGFDGRPAYPLYASPLLTPAQRVGEGQYHRNIRFVKNKIKT